MTPRRLAEEIAEQIAERLEEYLQEREAELQERTKAGVEITLGWNGYEITIAGHRITAEHDSSMHRWRFRVLENYEEFFSISEAKGRAIVNFLQALSDAIKSSQDRRAASEDSFVRAVQDPATGSEENFGDENGY